MVVVFGGVGNLARRGIYPVETFQRSLEGNNEVLLCLAKRVDGFTKPIQLVGELSNLTELDVFGLLSELPDSIGKLSNLTMLGVHCNQLSKLPDSIGELSNLSSLDISDNQLNRLPKSIKNLPTDIRRELRKELIKQKFLGIIKKPFGNLFE